MIDLAAGRGRITTGETTSSIPGDDHPAQRPCDLVAPATNIKYVT